MCFGGRLLRGNRTQKVDSSSYQAFDSPSYPPLATLGVNTDWAHKFLLPVCIPKRNCMHMPCKLASIVPQYLLVQ